MGVLSSTLRVSLRDGVSAPARRITGALKSMKQAGTGMGARMGVDRLHRQMTAQTQRMSRGVKRLNGGGMGGLAATAGAAAFLRNESQVQSSMNMTQAILNTSTEAFKEHRDEVVKLAKKWPTTRNEIAKGASELAMSGMSLKQVNEVLEATVQGSMASGESIKTVGMGVTDVVMGLGQELTRGNFLKINNVMVAAATSYAQGYKQFLDGLAKTAPIARMQGMAVERLAGMLGILADAGFKGAKGGTALKTSMINAAAPTKKALDLLKQHKIDLSQFRERVDTFQLGGAEGAKSLSGYIADALNVDAKSVNLGKILEPILSDKKAFKNIPKLKRRLGAAIRDALDVGDVEGKAKIGEAVNRFVEAGFQSLDFEALMRALAAKGLDKSALIMKELFGKRFVAQMAALINSMNPGKDGEPGAFDKKMNEIFLPRIEGAVKRFAAILMQGLPGALKRLAGAFDGLMDAMASSGALDTVVGALEALRDGINFLSKTSPGLLKAITLIGLGAGLLAPLGFALAGVAALFTVITSAATIAGAAVAFMARGVLMGFGSMALTGVSSAWDGVSGSVTGAKAAIKGFLNPARLVRVAMLALRAVMKMSWISAFIGVLVAGGKLIYDNWSVLKELFIGVGTYLREALGDAFEVLQALPGKVMAAFAAIDWNRLIPKPDWSLLAAGGFGKFGSGLLKQTGLVEKLTSALVAQKGQASGWGQVIGDAVSFAISKLKELVGFITGGFELPALDFSTIAKGLALVGGAALLLGPLRWVLDGTASALRLVAAGAHLVVSVLHGMVWAMHLVNGLLHMFSFLLKGLVTSLKLARTAIIATSTALWSMSRAAVAGTTSLVVSGVAAAWSGVTSAIVGARRALAGFMLLSAVGGKGFAIKTMAASMGATALSMAGSLAAIANPAKLASAAIHGVGIAIRFAFIATGVGAVIAAIAMAGVWIYNNWTGIKEMFAGIGEGFMEALGPAGPAVKSMVSGLKEVWNWLTDILGPLDASKKDWREWGRSIGQALAWPVKKIGELVEGIAKIADFVIPDWVKQLASWVGTGVGKMLGLGGDKASEEAPKAPVKPEPVKKAPAKPEPVKKAPTKPAPQAISAITPTPAPAAASAAVSSLSQVESKATSTVGIVQGAMNQVKAVANIDLSAQGRKIMDMLAAGMKSRAATAVQVMRDTAQQLRDHLPSSPAKVGPLSDLHRLKFGETIASSIRSEPMVRAMRAATAATMAAATIDAGALPAAAGPAIKVKPGLARANARTAVPAQSPVQVARGPAGDIYVTVNIMNGGDPQAIGDEVGRKVRQAVDESYSDGGYI